MKDFLTLFKCISLECYILISSFLQEAMSSVAVQNVRMQGYHANRIREALERMALLRSKNRHSPSLCYNYFALQL